MAHDDVMEFSVGADGRYLGANQLALDTVGYSAEELRGLWAGALSRTDAPIVEEMWREFVAGEIHIPPDRASELVTRDGRVLAVEFLGLQRRADGSWVSRMRLVSGRSNAINAPRALHLVLQTWRDAERALAGLDQGDPRRARVEHDVEVLRDLYHRESKARIRAAAGCG